MNLYTGREAVVKKGEKSNKRGRPNVHFSRNVAGINGT